MTSIHPKTYAATPTRKLAFLGLGVMGYPMAAHLERVGHQVQVYNRTASKSIAWNQEFTGATGQIYAKTLSEVVSDADLVFCCVSNDAALRSITLGADSSSGAFAHMKRGAVFVDHTTASATLARELHSAAQQQGLHFVDAPVSGGQLGAKNGALTVMCGGDAPAVAAMQPVVMAYAKACTHMGPSGSGQLTKMVNQTCLAGLLQALSEALAFGQKAGLDMQKVLQVISQGTAQSWQMDSRASTMLADEFDFGFAVDWMRKDLGLVLDEAKRNGARLPVAALVDQFYADIQAQGGQRWDTSSLIRRLR